MVMSIEESLADLPTPNLPETPTMEVRKSNLSQEDICGVIRDITSIVETVHHDFNELKRNSTEKFQETDSLLKTIRYVLKNRGNYNEKNELMTIVALKLENQNLKHELYNKSSIINNLTEKTKHVLG